MVTFSFTGHLAFCAIANDTLAKQPQEKTNDFAPALRRKLAPEREERTVGKKAQLTWRS